MKGWLSNFRQGTRSLKTTLALYFIPISVLPALFISYYAIEIFEDSLTETLVRRANSERDAIVAEIDSMESAWLSEAQSHARKDRLIAAVRSRDARAIGDILESFRPDLHARVYTPDGKFLVLRKGAPGASQIPYISKEGLHRVRSRGETFERYFSIDGKSFVTVIRELIKVGNASVGILEEETTFGAKELSEIKNRREVDLVLLTREFQPIAGSFALSQEAVRNFSSGALQPSNVNSREPVFIRLGETRYSALLYDLPSQFGKNRHWGYLALFLSMTGVDTTVNKLKMALVYLTVLLILVSTLLIFIFSNRLVRPIEILVSAMKRVKTGRVEEIPNIDSAYEIEYLVRSFNDMSRNVSAAKRALEIKLDELRAANTEIVQTQAHLVQSAKMISLGQIVAGVAHELNNPIGFIYSNMHHLSEYVEKIRDLVSRYRELAQKLPEGEQSKLKEIEKSLDIDFILKDIDDLTRSCVEGARRTKEIVLGLRTFSRIEESSFRLADLHEGLRSTIRLLATEFKDRVQIHEDFGELPQVECNLSQMNQVFMNLLSNGAQAIGQKGDIWIRTRVEANEVCIDIEDNGSGMPKEVLDKIFDPFFTTKKVGEGTGLGLSIAYGLIQKHHGSIAVESEVGHGTRFRIFLPLRQPNETAS